MYDPAQCNHVAGVAFLEGRWTDLGEIHPNQRRRAIVTQFLKTENKNRTLASQVGLPSTQMASTEARIHATTVVNRSTCKRRSSCKLSTVLRIEARKISRLKELGNVVERSARHCNSPPQYHRRVDLIGQRTHLVKMGSFVHIREY